jgi:hypothetical protein
VERSRPAGALRTGTAASALRRRFRLLVILELCSRLNSCRSEASRGGNHRDRSFVEHGHSGSQRAVRAHGYPTGLSLSARDASARLSPGARHWLRMREHRRVVNGATSRDQATTYSETPQLSFRPFRRRCAAHAARIQLIARSSIQIATEGYVGGRMRLPAIWAVSAQVEARVSRARMRMG